MHEPHTELVNDTAKLIIGRLISRRLGRVADLVPRAAIRLEEVAARNGDTDYVQMWRKILMSDISEIQKVLRGKDDVSTWLRLTMPISPLDAGIPVHDTAFRRRLWRDARRLVTMGFLSEKGRGYIVEENCDMNFRRFG